MGPHGPRIGAGLAALLLGASLATSGIAQGTPTLDRLVNASATILPIPQVDRTVRPAKRYAVVIGNADYAAIPPLKNAVADADEVSAMLRQYGYLVHQYTDLTKRGFEEMMRRILFDLDRNTEVVLFFAGHGFQIGSENFLVPVDADLDTIYDVPFEAVSLGSVVGIVGARARLQVVILDSSRDNPFAGKEMLVQLGNTLRETRTGFTSQAAPLNSMLVYSTSPGALAFDGDGDNSPFTISLVTEAREAPEQLVKDTFENVRKRTVERTNGRQVPWDSSTLVEPVSFGLNATGLLPPADPASLAAGRGMAELVAAEGVPVIAADFSPEVAVGQAIVDALDLAPGDRITFQTRPETGFLMREDLTGLRREVTGQTLDAAAVSELVLVNQSVQIPARTLDTALITDGFTVLQDGTERQVTLELTPNPCDFEAGDHLDPDGMGITRYPNEIAPERALAACQAAVAAFPDVGRYHHQLGRAHLALRQTAEAKAAFETARDMGHARSWQELGLLARYAERGLGNSNVPDSDAVRQLFARGVAEGDPYAMHTLGYELLTNGGSPEVEVEGYDLMVRAMEVGHTFAMNALTGIYQNEDGEYYDPERALRYMKESAAREDIYGYHNLGIAYAYGQNGLEPDIAEAMRLLTLAADGGHPNAPMTLATLYQDGTAPGGVDLEKSVSWMEEALARGNASAAAWAAYLIRTEDVPSYDDWDAAVMAAKGATLSSRSGADAARDQLLAMPAAMLNGGAQRLIAELGEEVDVDGAWGAGSQRALDAVLAANDEGPSPDDPAERIQLLAAIYWSNTPLRVDLY